jgi:hypothetical protein
MQPGDARPQRMCQHPRLALIPPEGALASLPLARKKDHGPKRNAIRRLVAKKQFIEILFKPVDEQVLSDAIARALGNYSVRMCFAQLE